MSMDECIALKIEPKEFLFYSNKTFMTSLKDFMIATTKETYPYSRDNFDQPYFDEFYVVYTLLYREHVFRTLRNLAR
jgi:hypothetical protein